MIFVETPTFMRLAVEYLPDDEFRQVQALLIARPTAGDVIHGTAGARKHRWRESGCGKRGGIRIIYCCHVSTSRIYLLLMYPNNVQDDLTQDQIGMVRKLVEKLVEETV